nr:reverse transcriptase domain-containing protein [Tanacetum cinerariifolium]
MEKNLNMDYISETSHNPVIEEDGPTWMTQIADYLKEGVLPGDNKEARKLRLKARQYELREGVLYRRSFLTSWLRCVGPLQADYVMREIHEGSCSMHAGPRSVVAKAIRLGPLSGGAGEGQVPDSRNGLLHEVGRSQGGGNDYRRAEIGMPTYRTAAVDVVNNDKELRLNFNLLEEHRERAAVCEARAKSKMMKYYNARVRGVAFKPGDFVYRSNDASHAVAGEKLGPKWEGLYEVTEALGNEAYKLRSTDGTQKGETLGDHCRRRHRDAIRPGMLGDGTRRARRYFIYPRNIDRPTKYGIPETLHPELPGQGDRIVDFPEGKVSVYTMFFEFANFRLSLTQFLFDVLGKRPGKNTPQCYTKPLDSLKNWNNRFFWVDERVFPTVVDWRTNASKDRMPANGTYSVEDVRALDTHRTPIQKQPEMLLCMVEISRRYYLGDEVYPTFHYDDDREMNLFSLIRAPNPTKVKTGSRPRAPHEVPLLTLTATRVIEMDEPAVATDSSGVPSTIERSPLDFAHEAEASGRGTAAPEMPSPKDVPTTTAPGADQVGEVVAEKPSAARESRKRGHDGTDANAPPKSSLLNCVPYIIYRTNCRSLTTYMDLFNLIRAPNPTKMDEPAATDSSGVPSTIERSPLDFVHEAEASDQGAAAPEMPSSEDVPATAASGAGQAEETATMDLPAAPESRKRGHDGTDMLQWASVTPIRYPLPTLRHAIMLTLPTSLEAEANAKRAAEDKSAGLSQELKRMRAQFSDLQVSNERLSQQVATLQQQVSGEEKLKAAFEEFKRQQDERVEQRCAEMDARLDALSIDFDEELYPYMLTAIAGRRSPQGVAAAGNPKSENVPPPAEVGSPGGVRAGGQAAVKTRCSGGSPGSKNPSPGVKNKKPGSTARDRGRYEESCRREECWVSGEETLKADFEEYKQRQDQLVEQRCTEMDARLDALSIDFDEELYPHMLTAIADRRWVIGYGLRLALMKCAESLEMRQAFADVVSAGVAKGMSEGLKHGVEHGHAKLTVESLEAYDPEAEAKFAAALQSLKDLKYPLLDQLEGLKDAPMYVIMAALYLESDTGGDTPQFIRDLRPSSPSPCTRRYVTSETLGLTKRR